MKALLIILAVIAGLFLVFVGAVVVSTMTMLEVAPLSEIEAARVLAKGNGRDLKPIDVGQIVPGSIVIKRRPSPHAAEIECLYLSGKVKWKRGMILKFVPSHVAGNEHIHY